MRISPELPRIETHEAAEHFMCALCEALSGTWHWKQRRRQRPMPSSTLPMHSLMANHGAPALRQSARKRTNHDPPPQSRHPPRGAMAHGAAPAVEWRQAALPATKSETSNAETWRLRRQQVKPGSAAPALLRAARRQDLAPWRPLAKKSACKVRLFIFPASDRATLCVVHVDRSVCGLEL